jgi:hypothetical protein
MTGGWPDFGTCVRCGAPGARVHIGDEELCDRCADRKVAGITGLPLLPDPPPDEIFTGPDGRKHRLHYRLWRAPTGMVAETEEADLPPGDGYFFKIMGPHDADAQDLVEALRLQARRSVGHQDLEPNPYRGGWILRGDTVSGRLEWSEEGLPYSVVVDGRKLSWEEFGFALEAFEGWNFTLRIDEMPMMTDSAGDSTSESLTTPRDRGA